jgi:hypothetical protein
VGSVMIERDERIELLEKIIDNISNWDGKLDSAIKLIELNNQILEKIKELKIDNQVKNELYEEKLVETVKLLDDFLKAIKKERAALIEENKQLSLKDKVLQNYIPKINDTIFIDKDVL